MDRHMQTGVRVKIRTITVIILSALILSIILVMAFPHRTGALLPEVVQGATTLLNQATAPLVSPASPPQTISPSRPPLVTTPAPSSSSPAAASRASAAATSSPSAPSTPLVATATSLMNAELQKINFIKARDKATRTTLQSASVEAGSSMSFMWVQATNEGWKLLGVLWYWWVLLVAGIGASILIWKHKISWFFISLWSSLQLRTYAK